MRTNIDIENCISRLKGYILHDVMNGCFSDRTLQEHRDWIEALQWVLQDDDNEFDN